INSFVPGTIFLDDSSLSSFLDSGDLSYDSPTLPSSSSSSPHTANKSGGGDGSGSNGGGGGDHIGQIEVNSTIQTILVVLGFGVGALFLLGVVAMYYITHKNRRAEEKKKRREEESESSKAGQSTTSLPLSSSLSSLSSLPLPSHPNISAGTGTAAAAAVGRENPAHRIIITRSMTATTANTRVGTGGPNDEKDNCGGSGGLSPIGDGKSDMVSIYIDEMPDDDEIRARHHCDDDDDGGCEEKQELDEKRDDEESLSQERNHNLMNAYSSPHNGL
ncbi:hypothetical protein BGX30_001745, partial [Mortierella sp. GBA39]